MKQLLLFAFLFSIAVNSNAQLTQPSSSIVGAVPSFNQQYKAPGDSCGAYFNNYIGLTKTTNVFFEALRTGANPEFNTYGGRAQRFHANQPIEISGVQFYAFETNTLLDSIMAITMLHEYTAFNDSVGTLLAVDTVWVVHQAFSAVLPNIEVNSFFDTPVTVTDDYIVTVYTPTDDSLKIIVSSAPANDGAGEGVSFLIYNNPDFLSAAGYYNGFANFGVSYDLDYLINPRVKYDLNDGFILSDDSICPNVISAGCVTYAQQPVYADPHYNGYNATASNHLLWLWGDGFQNTNLLTACHTYTNSGDYNISLSDTLRRHDFLSPTCVGQVVNPIHVIPDVVASFTFVANGTIVDFTNTSAPSDSVWWDFGDTLAGSSATNPQHTFPTIGTYDVWLYAYNECSEDSVMIQVTVDDVGTEKYNFDFKIYPNPANDNVTISGLVEGTTLELLNILGERVQLIIPQGNSTILATEGLSNGTYFVRVSTELGQVTKKLVVRH